MKQSRKVSRIKKRFYTVNGTQRDIVRDFCSNKYSQIVCAARRADTGLWEINNNAQHDQVFYACELILGSTRAEILVEHLDRMEEENGA